MCFCSVTSKSLMIVELFSTWNNLYEIEANWFYLVFSNFFIITIDILIHPVFVCDLMICEFVTTFCYWKYLYNINLILSDSLACEV